MWRNNKNRCNTKTKQKRKQKNYIRRESFFLSQFNKHDCNIVVFEYQLKIYENIKKKNIWVARSFQKQLVNTIEAYYLSARKVITNKGGTTPGVDGYIPTTRKDYE